MNTPFYGKAIIHGKYGITLEVNPGKKTRICNSDNEKLTEAIDRTAKHQKLVISIFERHAMGPTIY